MDLEEVRVGPIRYQLNSQSWLNRPRATYAAERLWSLISGTSEEIADFPGVVEIIACDSRSPSMLAQTPQGKLPSVSVTEVLPEHMVSPIESEDLPILFHGPRTADLTPWIEKTEEGLRTGVDLVAATFFMLSRWEERSEVSRDRHERFPATASVAWRHGFLDRPIIDEWALIVRVWIMNRFPAWRPKPSRFRVHLSCDVDHPLRYPTLLHAAKSCGAAIARHGSLLEGFRHLHAGWRTARSWQDDRNYKDLLWILELAESLGISCHVYFMAASPAAYDSGYDPIHDTRCRAMIEQVEDRGHEVGFHPGYSTYCDPSLFRDQHARLGSVVRKRLTGGRQHYLRFKVPETWRIWESAGLSYDSTLGYAEAPGFRCGTCHPYPVYDCEAGRQLSLVEVPLIVMDASVRQYLGLDTIAAIRLMQRLAARCRAVDGTFSLLIHNHVPGKWKPIFENVLRQILDR